ncbi:MAG: hypothetical protein IJ557_02570 [Bacteroidaceae bacterium]|nr:hypothetical protein [Bacteroidaceae bacterium]
MKATSSITQLNKDRIALNIVTDNMQSLVFLNRIEFLELMAHMFEYRDKHKVELQEAINMMQEQN